MCNICVLVFFYIIYHIQAYTLPLPLNPIKIGIFVPIHHIYCFMLAMCYVLVYYSQNITMTIYCAIILCLLLYLSFIFAHGLYSHFMLGITFLRLM